MAPWRSDVRPDGARHVIRSEKGNQCTVIGHIKDRSPYLSFFVVRNWGYPLELFVDRVHKDGTIKWKLLSIRAIAAGH